MRILLIIYDNDSFIHRFPLGLSYIAAVLKQQGYDVTIYNQDVHHYPETHLTQFLDENKFDVVGLGIIAGYYQYQKLLRISRAINQSKNRPFYILGGHGPSPEPRFFMEKTKADLVVMGEGETTIIQVMEHIANHQSLSKVKGIAFRDGDNIIINEARPLIQNIDHIPLPVYDLFPIDHYKLLRLPHTSNHDFVMAVITGRGCPFTCNFCYRMDKGIRLRSNESVIEEIKTLKSRYGITYIVFYDELLMTSKERTVSLCQDFERHHLNIKWFCNGRLNYAEPDLLKLMKKAGCVFINYGIEAMDDQVLKNMNKALTTSQIIKGIEATLAAGISPGYNIIFGNIGDNKETLEKAVQFLLKYDDGSQFRTIRPVTPYPGSPLYDFALEKGLLKDCADFYENKHLNSDLLAVNFTELSDNQFYQSLLNANTRLMENYYHQKYKADVKMAKELYLKRDKNFRGFRQV